MKTSSVGSRYGDIKPTGARLINESYAGFVNRLLTHKPQSRLIISRRCTYNVYFKKKNDLTTILFFYVCVLANGIVRSSMTGSCAAARGPVSRVPPRTRCTAATKRGRRRRARTNVKTRKAKWNENERKEEWEDEKKKKEKLITSFRA